MDKITDKITDNLQFIKVDNNTIINIKTIRWVKKMDECLAVCNKSDGCTKYTIHTLCKVNNNDSYNLLNKYFN
jgi:hypothetical protein